MNFQLRQSDSQESTFTDEVRVGDRVWLNGAGWCNAEEVDADCVVLREDHGSEGTEATEVMHGISTKQFRQLFAMRQVISCDLPPIWSSWTGQFNGIVGTGKVLGYEWDTSGGTVELDFQPSHARTSRHITMTVADMRRQIDAGTLTHVSGLNAEKNELKKQGPIAV